MKTCIWICYDGVQVDNASRYCLSTKLALIFFSAKVNSTTGIITVTNLQDAVDPRWRYVLNVSVTDGVFINYVKLEVNVRNSNHYDPVFERQFYDVVFKENQPIG